MPDLPNQPEGPLVPEPSQRPTAVDVARLAGVSQSAVSRAFSANASVSSKTRNKVLEAARILGYQPSFAAGSLVTGVSKIIGVAVAGLGHSFYAEIVQTLSTTLAAFGFRPMLFSLESEDKSDPILNEVLRYRVDAIILVSANISSRFAEDCAQAGVPVVLLNRGIRSSSTAVVKGDDFGGAYQIGRFLTAGGHERYGFVSGPRQAMTSRERWRGFQTALSEAGVEDIAVIDGEFTYESGVKAAYRFLQLPKLPDAVFCGNDDMAIGFIDEIARQLGEVVGRDLSVVGFDDIPLARRFRYRLTTYRQPIREMARAAVHLAVQATSGKDTGRTATVLPGQLVVRLSSRLPTSGISRLANGETTWDAEPVAG